MPTRLMAGERRRGREQGKSDPIDALAGARAALKGAGPDYLAPVGRPLPAPRPGPTASAPFRPAAGVNPRLRHRLSPFPDPGY